MTKTRKAEQAIIALGERVKRPISLKDDIKPLFAGGPLQRYYTLAVWNLRVRRERLVRIGRGLYRVRI